MEETRKQVVLYTDGGCQPNPGPGGYGVVLLFGEHRKELSGGFRYTTNNRMEILAAIRGLEALKMPCLVTLHSDSQYLVQAMEKGWVRRWKKNRWMRTEDERTRNVDLWERLLPLLDTHHVKWVWVRGHAGNPNNERCDALATAARLGTDLASDEAYERAETEPVRPAAPEAAPAAPAVDAGGGACRKCGKPLVKKVPKAKPKAGQVYCYDWYWWCTGCGTVYFAEEARRAVGAVLPRSEGTKRKPRGPKKGFKRR